MAYADCFVLPVPVKKLAAYKALAKKVSKIWMEHGALEYRECVGEDLGIAKQMKCVPFMKMAKAKASETVFVSWIIYKNRAHRDRVNAKIMADPRMAAMCDMKNLPFDVKRMACGGFSVLVEG